jgi:SNF2 family DNA or RNA helicase
VIAGLKSAPGQTRTLDNVRVTSVRLLKADSKRTFTYLRSGLVQTASQRQKNMTAGGQWTDRRLLLFTEYEDTRRWLERRLLEALHDLDPEDLIACFTGATSTDRREELKRRFNADPVTDPLRILICTDAAREGIHLQARCRDRIHIDLPWNPARLEQRNGRAVLEPGR